MADEQTADTVAAKAAAGQGVTTADANESNGGEGNPTPAAPSNEPPDTTPTDEEKKVAAEKLETEKAAADEKAAAEKKTAEDKATEDKDNTPLDTDVWGSTGNEVADSVLTMLQNAEVSPDEAKALLFDAVKEGDVSKIDVAALEAKVGKTKATLIMAGINTFVREQGEKTSAIVADVQKAAGGEDNWKTIAAWSKANLPEADLSEYRDMIDNGGAQARFAVSEMAAKFNADEANTSITTGDTTPSIEGDGGKGASARSTTRAEYVAELTKAHKLGASDAVLNEITQARHRGRASGLT